MEERNRFSNLDDVGDLRRGTTD
uniref:ER membrane protein complex subunit 8/9 homolog n=1 Tax=Rhizophora mucronata TaxID=61149 RepID=A0A2P2JNZ5_RHIMU